MPIVTTLHTILPEPDAAAARGDGRAVAAVRAPGRHEQHGAEPAAPTCTALPQSRSTSSRTASRSVPTPGCTARTARRRGAGTVLLTFGLLSPDKGIEYVIDALPAILERHPDIVYIVLGATHPHVKERHGEAYRLMLEARARRLGVDEHVIFHDRFVEHDELTEFLGAADIYVTPYLNPEQSTSGTLAYAVGAGKAVISTPYRYARELLADGRGVLVPWRDSPTHRGGDRELSTEDEPRRMAARRARRRVRPRHAVARVVARDYLQTFRAARARPRQARVRVNRSRRRRSAQRAARAARHQPRAPARADRRHGCAAARRLRRAALRRRLLPRRQRARAAAHHADRGGRQRAAAAVRALASRYLAFVPTPSTRARGRFRNFMTLLASLGRRARLRGLPRSRDLGARHRHRAGARPGAALATSSSTPRCRSRSFTSPRAWARAARHRRVPARLRRRSPGEGARSVSPSACTTSCDAVEQMAGGSRSSRTPTRACPKRSSPPAHGWAGPTWSRPACVRSTWLIGDSAPRTACSRRSAPTASATRGGEAARFDQQPIEAATSHGVPRRRAGDRRPDLGDTRAIAFDWFLGQNQLDRWLYDPSTGGCRDGLHDERPNENQGAESTLSFLLALVDVRGLDRPVRRTRG